MNFCGKCKLKAFVFAVEQAAQAARKAEASAAATTASFYQEGPSQTYPLQAQEGQSLTAVSSLHLAGPNCNGIVAEEHQDASSFTVYRHPDDIQAAQGLAALGKGGYDLPFEGDPVAAPTGRPPPKGSRTSKIVQKLLEEVR